MELKALKTLLQKHVEYVSTEKDHVTSEADVRRSLVLPLFTMLGYNTSSSSEVKTEYPIDMGKNKQDEADLVIMRDGKPCIVVECKKGNINDPAHRRQLKGYFQNLTDSKFGVLTNGIKYQFYTDKDQANVMEDEPFFEFDVMTMQDDEVDILRKFNRGIFDLGAVADIAREQRCTAGIKSRLLAEMENPSDEFVRCVAQDFITTFRGPSAPEQTKKQLEQLQASIRKAFEMVIKDKMPKKAAHSAASTPASPTVAEDATTEAEVECYHAIQTVLAMKAVCEPNRLFLLPRKNHVVICLDDNQRKPIARLYLREEKKIIEVYDDSKKPCPHDYKGIKDVFTCMQTIVESVEIYDGKRQPRPESTPPVNGREEAECADNPPPSAP